MKAHLLFPDRDLDLGVDEPIQQDDLDRDLGIDLLIEAMADGDQWFAQIGKLVVSHSLDDATVVKYRQQILRDCLQNSDLVRELYDLSVSALLAQRKVWRTGRHPDSVLHGAVQSIELFVADLKTLREFARANAERFTSPGFTAFFATVIAELDDAYFDEIKHHLRQLEFRRGVTLSSKLGPGNKSSDIVLRETPQPTGGWFKRATAKAPEHYSFRIPERDDAGFRALSDLRGRAVNNVANAVAQSADHVTSYFGQLRAELAFYLGCLNLHQHLGEKDRPICWPEPRPLDRPWINAKDLCDVGLCLREPGRVVGNDLKAQDVPLVVVTGANQGGKSTFLRSIGLAQLMMQCGMFVAAEMYTAGFAAGIYTHYRREEDAEMNSGKLDEELARMSTIVDFLTPNCMVLFNESFAATNEREGSEIARQVVRALLETSTTVYFVTHLHELANSLFEDSGVKGVFLRAERDDAGRRTFRLAEGRPLPTAYGLDLYDAIFSARSDNRSAAS
jgi:hypothetical protein